MDATLGYGAAQPKDCVDGQKVDHLKQWWINRQIQAEFMDIPKHVAWHAGMRVYDVRFREVEDGWQVLVKAVRKNRCFVTFLWGQTYAEALEVAGDMLFRGAADWKVDRFPPEHLRGKSS